LTEFMRAVSQRVPAESILRLQQELDQTLLHAEEHLARPAGGHSGEFGPNGRSLNAWYQQFRDQFPVRPKGPERSIPPPAYSAALQEGELYCWQTGEDTAPVVTLNLPASLIFGRLLATGLLGAFLLVLVQRR
jgi:hypothetical protein